MEGRKRLSLALAGAGIIAALTIALVGGRTTQPGVDAGGVAGEVDVLIRETAAAVQARADTLAQLPRLSWAVATDEATVRDMTTEELAFRTRPGEHIEIAHQDREGEKRLNRLLRLPADPSFPLPMAAGAHLVLHDGKAHAVAVVPVEPRERADELIGLIAVARVLETAALDQRLAERGIHAELRKGDAAIALGRAEPPESPARAKSALSSPSAAGVELTVLAPTKASGGSLFLSFAVGLLSLAAAAFLWLRKGEAAPLSRGAARATPSRPTPARATPARQTPARQTPARQTPISPPVASARPEIPWEAGGGDVADIEEISGVEVDKSDPGDEEAAEWDDGVKTDPVLGQLPEVEASASPDGHGALPVHVASMSGNGSESRRGGGIVSSGFDLSHSGRVDLAMARSGSIQIPTDRAVPPLPPPFGTQEDPRTEEYRALFTEYLRLRRTTGEALDPVDANVFVETLKEKRLQLIRDLGVPDVRFRLAFDNGKAAIRYVVLGAAKRSG